MICEVNTATADGRGSDGNPQKARELHFQAREFRCLELCFLISLSMELRIDIIKGRGQVIAFTALMVLISFLCSRLFLWMW